jgi:hypothetical protein
MEAIKHLVQADPSMVTVPCLPAEHRDLPLTRTTATMTPLYMAWVGAVNDRRLKKPNKCKRVEKAQLLLEAAFFHSKNVNPSVPKDYHFISGAIALDLYLPDQVVPMAIDHFPKELRHADEDGRVALAQASASIQYSKERSDTMIRLLLNVYAEAASMRDREGRSPLQLALLAGKTWTAGVSRLFEAHPEAIGWTDVASGLPPFAAAASLEAQEAATMSSELCETITGPSLIRRNDPYNLLNMKQREMLFTARKRLERDEHKVEVDPDTERLTTILDLLRADPAALAS